MKKWLRGGLAVLVIGAGMFATLGEAESGGGGDSADSGNGDSTETTAAEAASSTQENPIPLGTDVEVAAGWNLKVNSAELDANATVAAVNQFFTPDPGNQYVIVNVTITNASDQPGEPWTNLKVSLLPPSGVSKDREILIGLPNEIDTMAQMQPGASVTGVVPFQVPSAEIGGTVLLGQSVFTLDEAADQKFFAIQ
jgi:hypothetical protein